MRAVFMIPRNPPAQLDGTDYSRNLKEFVALCLNDDPEVRPTAENLLKCKLLKTYVKQRRHGTSAANPDLIELLLKYRKWCELQDENGRDSDDSVDVF